MKDGGPAFPVLEYEFKASGDLHPSPTTQSGMSLRDWFAGMAMSYCAGVSDSKWEACALAYEYADEMLIQRKQK